MRNAFASEITELAARDERVVLLMADIGNRLFNEFRERFPGRFYNTGVAEANTISMAAGMASEGLRPFCYTITPFITARCLEQIRIDVCYHRQPVTIIGTGSGLSYASLGVTHHSCEDIATMRALPEMKVLAPADAMEVRSCLRLALSCEDSPVYLRIGKKNEPVFHPEIPAIAFGEALLIEEGSEGGKVCLLVTGNLLPSAIEAGRKLADQTGACPRIYSCPSVKPLPLRVLQDCLSGFEVVATVEEHSLVGGFSAAVAEWICDQGDWPAARFVRIATEDRFLHETTNQKTARDRLGVGVSAIVEKISLALRA